ncbi:MAG: hypothetical protein DRR08_15755 [Candidatus Parabeggiatoa sp. nov. 2]|nr:MAG: hypothetical protein B6247_05515 [Beggiatoa sp. 4572_84]RKZ58684.1 MAG: hypothetical protein DRR08_15755 [Gammaproteobacteria bacterium]
MYHTNQLTKLVFFILCCGTMLVSCVTPKTQPPKKAPTDFEVAVRTMANGLLEQAINHPKILESQEQTLMVIDRFVDANSGEVVEKVSRRIEQIILDESQKHLDQLTIVKFTPQNLQKAQYMISGVIDFNNPERKGYHRVSVSISSLGKTGEILADSSSFISAKDLDYTPTPKYQDSPMYLTGKHFGDLATLAASLAGKLPQKEQYDSLDTNTLIEEAETRYDNQDYEKSLVLYYLAQKRPDGQSVKTYAGLYQTTLKLVGHQAAAEEAFGKLLAASVKENNKFNLKFLFPRDSTEFIDDQQLRNEYAFWLHQIANYFKNNNQCFHIVGHSSQRGNIDYNYKLSLLRAQKIQNLIGTHFPEVTKRSKVIGKGFQEGLASVTGKVKNTIDRRVEIVVVDCSQI